MKHRITDAFVAQQKWAERGGLAEQHEALAAEAVSRNVEQQQRLADIRDAEMYDFDAIDRAWRADHTILPTEQVLIEMREYIRNAVAARERAK